MFKLRIKFKKTTRKLQMYDITPYDKNPSTRLNNGWFNSSENDSCAYSLFLPSDATQSAVLPWKVVCPSVC